jgi:glyoxylase-like metal-dependent hydrolase (beta-lactamase superfamily II)
VIDAGDIIRLRTGFATVPAVESAAHAGERLMMCAYVIRHPQGIFLFDTGIGEDPIVDELYQPVRWRIDDQLAALGIQLGEVAVVANCHLHFDHSGGNSLFPRIPILAQRVEHRTASEMEDYTIPGIADFPGARYELLDGEAPVWPGITVLPSPGHTAGHQSVVVETRQGRVVLAGQSFNRASDYASARLVQELRQSGYPVDAGYPAWMDAIDALDPWRVLFAHDVASWERGPRIPPAPRTGGGRSV